MKVKELEKIYKLVSSTGSWENLVQNASEEFSTLKKIFEDSKNKVETNPIIEIAEEDFKEIKTQIKNFFDETLENLNDTSDSKFYMEIMERIINFFWSENFRNSALSKIIEYSIHYLENKNVNKHLHFVVMQHTILYLNKKKEQEEKIVNERLQVITFFITRTFVFSNFSKENDQVFFERKYQTTFFNGKELLKTGEKISFIYNELFILIQESSSICNILEDLIVKSKSDFIVKDENVNDLNKALSSLIKQLYYRKFQYPVVLLLLISIMSDILPEFNLSKEGRYEFQEEIITYIGLLYTD
jgi:hypothetical protein